MRTVTAVTFAAVAAAGAAAAAVPPPAKAILRQRLMELPLSFEANEGQAERAVKFLSRGPGYAVFLTESEAVVALRDRRHRAPLRIRTVGGRPRALSGLDPLTGTSNYFVGSDPRRWHTGIRTYARVEYRDVYPGVSLVYYGNQRRLEYDFVVSPGVDPKAILLAFEGADRLAIDARGDLVLTVEGGEIRMERPVVYEESGRGRDAVAGRYVLRGPAQVGFEVGPYDDRKRLVIDPVLAYSTYLGGSAIDQAAAIAVDSAGNAYVTGSTTSLDFPVSAGAPDSSFNGFEDAFVTKLDPTGTTLIYSTYLGGSTNGDDGRAIAVDGSGAAYVTGSTASSDFPTTSGAFDGTSNGHTDAFLTKIHPDGSSLVYSTFLGGADSDYGTGVAVDASGNAFVSGLVSSANFPTTTGALDTALGGNGDAFVSKLNSAGSALVYSTYLGGSDFDLGTGVVIDATGAAYVAGYTRSADFPTTALAFDTSFNGPFNGTDAFVSKLDAAGTVLLYSTYLGGSDIDFAWEIALDLSGSAYVTGSTFSTDFPTTGGAFDTALGGPLDAFVTKLDAAGAALAYSTYLGGSDTDDGLGIAVDATGQALVTGDTTSSDFPTTAGAAQPVYGGNFDAFVTKLNAAGSAPVQSTYLGGSSQEQGIGIAVSPTGDAYVAGWTDSADFPTSSGAFDTTLSVRDAFVTMLTEAALIGPPTTKDECKDGGWRRFNNPAFRNQGQCVSYVVSRRNR
jgi:hypothetical protein